MVESRGDKVIVFPLTFSLEKEKEITQLHMYSQHSFLMKTRKETILGNKVGFGVEVLKRMCFG